MFGGAVKPWHLLILALLLVVLFGAKRLPDSARALGRSLRIFKAETKNLLDDDVKGKAEAQTGGRVVTPEIPDDQASPLPRPEPVEPRRDER